MKELQLEVIVLSSMPFKDYDRIVTAFSKERGLVKFIVNGAHRKKSTLIPFCEPLCHAYVLLQEKQSELHKFIEGKILRTFLELRKDYDLLLNATTLLKVVQKSHLFNQGAQNTFVLLTGYLKRFSQFDSPYNLVASFYLKMLLQEGSLNLRSTCSKCLNKEERLYFYSQNYFCKTCSMDYSLPFEQVELKLMLELLKVRSFDTLKDLKTSKETLEKIAKLYKLSCQT